MIKLICRQKALCAILLFAFFLATNSSEACTVVMAGKKATAEGDVILSYTCDGWYDHRLTVVPGKENPKGAVVPMYKNKYMETRPDNKLVEAGTIPEVKKTYSYFNTSYPIMNEKSVVIGEHTWGGRDESECPTAMMMIEQLEALGLQRGATARETLKVITELAEKYGYGDRGEALAIADKDEIWLLEITGPGAFWKPESGKPGAVWAAVRVPDDSYSVGANRSRIGEINFSDQANFMYSSNIKDIAKEMGWWKEGEKFVFYNVYGPEAKGRSPYLSQRREWRACGLLSPSVKLAENSKAHYPLFMKPDKPITVRDIMKVNRDYLEGTRFDLTKGLAAGPFGSPVRNSVNRDQKPEKRKYNYWDRSISEYYCSFSIVSRIRSGLPEEIAALTWFGLDQPATCVYMPIYAGAKYLPKSLAIYDRAKFNQESAYWAFNFVANWANLKYSYMIKDIRAKQSELENGFFASAPSAEKAFMEKYKSGDRAGASDSLTLYVNESVNKACAEWWNLAWHLVGKYSDGYVIDDNGKAKTVGYPTEWLKEAGFGDNDAEPKK